jgi:hypothetical protein
MGIASIPLWTRSAPAVARHESSSARRLIAGLIAIGCGGVLGLAAWLEPSPTGLGTHEALSMPRCGWIAIADLPCPTCGMTTAFAHAANGDLAAALVAQPMGFLLALATAMTCIVGSYVVLTGSRVHRVFGRLCGIRTAWAVSFMVLAAWGFKTISYKGWL